jgi:hypothetical protein
VGSVPFQIIDVHDLVERVVDVTEGLLVKVLGPDSAPEYLRRQRPVPRQRLQKHVDRSDPLLLVNLGPLGQQIYLPQTVFQPLLLESVIAATLGPLVLRSGELLTAASPPKTVFSHEFGPVLLEYFELSLGVHWMGEGVLVCGLELRLVDLNCS